MDIGEASEALIPGDHDRGWEGTITYEAPWATASLDSETWFYLYDDGSHVAGSIHFSHETLMPIVEHHVPAAWNHEIVSPRDSASALPEGRATCLRAPGTLTCTGQLRLPSGHQTGFSATYDRVETPNGTEWDGPFTPEDTQEDGICPGGQSACGATGCCPPHFRCGDSSCWEQVIE